MIILVQLIKVIQQLYKKLKITLNNYLLCILYIYPVVRIDLKAVAYFKSATAQQTGCNNKTTSVTYQVTKLAFYSKIFFDLFEQHLF